MNVSVNCDVNGLVEALRQLGYDIAEASQPYLAHLYEVYVRQAIIEAWLMIAGCGLCLVVLLLAGLSERYLVKGDWEAPSFRNVGTFIGLLAGGLGFACTLISVFVSALPRLYNPEFYAIQSLLQHLPK